MLGLDRGGSCRGRAFRVAATEAHKALAYLDERELITPVYHRRVLPIRVAGTRVEAYTYVVDRSHVEYAGKLSPERVAEVILHGHGPAGDNRSYLENTVAHLDDLGIADGPLHTVLRLVERRDEG